MKTEDEIRALKRKVQEQVDTGLKLGLSPRPQTPLEAHAFAAGRLSILEWMAPEPEEGE